MKHPMKHPMKHQCSQPLCSSPVTRQIYSDDWDASDPWAAEGFALWCAEHAPADSWPAVASVCEVPVETPYVYRCVEGHYHYNYRAAHDPMATTASGVPVPEAFTLEGPITINLWDYTNGLQRLKLYPVKEVSVVPKAGQEVTVTLRVTRVEWVGVDETEKPGAQPLAPDA